MNLPEHFWTGVFGSVVFGFVGLVFMIGGFKIFDWILPKVDFQQELKNNPMATAVVVAAFLLGLSYIIGSCVH